MMKEIPELEMGIEQVSKRPLVVATLRFPRSRRKATYDELAQKFGVEPIQVKYPDAQFWEEYKKDPSGHNAIYLSHALTSTFDQLKEKYSDNVILLDPTPECHLLNAKVNYELGAITQDEWWHFQALYSDIVKTGGDKLGYPNIYIVEKTNPADLKQVIKNGGNPYEIWMMENYPNYLVKFSESINEWQHKYNIK